MNRSIRTAAALPGRMGILYSALINSIVLSDVVAVCDANWEIARHVERSGLDAPFYSDVDRQLGGKAPAAFFLGASAFTHLLNAEKWFGRR